MVAAVSSANSLDTGGFLRAHNSRSRFRNVSDYTLTRRQGETSGHVVSPPSGQSRERGGGVAVCLASHVRFILVEYTSMDRRVIADIALSSPFYHIARHDLTL